MKTVLCYGDSLTWGVDAENRTRHAYEDRWTSVLQKGLGHGVRVIAEGLNGRTTVYDDYSADCDRNGARILPTLLETHSPLDLVIILLGTNDLKPVFANNAVIVGHGVKRLVEIIRHHAWPMGMDATPDVLIVAPPVLCETEDPLLGPMFAGRIGEWVDLRLPACLGLAWLGVVSLLRARWAIDLGFWSYAFPQLLQGLGTPFFFIGLMTLALGAVPPRETASAAGLMAFMRTLCGALATSITTTAWFDGTQEARAQLAGVINGGTAFLEKLSQSGFTKEQARGVLEQLVERQGAAISASHLFVAIGLLCIAAAQLTWIIPRPKGGVAAVAAH